MPLYRKREFENGMVLTIWKIEETEHELRPLLSLDEKEEEELLKIKASNSRARWMASRLALKSVFEEWKTIQIKKDSHGKPSFELLTGNFSLSHSGDFAVCAYHPDKMVGIDVEEIRPKIFLIREKFMKPEELSFVEEENAMEYLIVSWCAKEAVYKWQGRKGVSMKDNIDIHPFDYKEEGHVKARLSDEENIYELIVNYERIEDYMLAFVCTV